MHYHTREAICQGRRYVVANERHPKSGARSLPLERQWTGEPLSVMVSVLDIVVGCFAKTLKNPEASRHYDVVQIDGPDIVIDQA